MKFIFKYGLMRLPLLLSFFLAVSALGSAHAQRDWKHGRLSINKDRQYFEFADGTPFFWLGDTAWELFFQLKLEEIKKYLDKRQSQGFNVIQVTLFFREYENQVNRYGQPVFVNNDIKHPNEKYFSLVDTVLKLAARKNMFIALLPGWGDMVVKMPGSKILLDSALASNYGFWLGRRYKNYPNLVWVMAGDRDPFKDSMDAMPVWRALANSIIEATGHKCLITFHPVGQKSSSKWTHNEGWLDFNMVQSSHGRRDFPVWEMISSDMRREPKKPSLDGEPNYEDHPVNPWPSWDPKSGYFRAYDVRKQLYRSVFAGAPGVTYGHHAVWQFLSERTEVVNYADRGWVNALDRPGANQVKWLKKLIENTQAFAKIRDTGIVVEGQGTESEHIESFRSADDGFAMIYLPVGKKIVVNVAFIKGTAINAWWYNPRDGSTIREPRTQKMDRLSFTPPTTGVENDWVLVLEEASRKGAPGSISN